MSPTAGWLACWFFLSAVATACHPRSGKPSGPGASSSSAGAVPSASAARASSPKPWFFGRWKGSYEVQTHAINVEKAQGLREWAKDNGSLAAGTGQLELAMDETGAALGSATGPLGDLQTSGEFDGQTLRLKLIPNQTDPATAFGGTIVAERSEQSLRGELNVSSGDSVIVRKGPVTLAKEAK